MTVATTLLDWGISALVVALISAVSAYVRRDVRDALLALWMTVIGAALVYPEAVSYNNGTALAWGAAMATAGRLLAKLGVRAAQPVPVFPMARVHSFRRAPRTSLRTIARPGTSKHTTARRPASLTGGRR